jgi:hypothetical protein
MLGAVVKEVPVEPRATTEISTLRLELLGGVKSLAVVDNVSTGGGDTRVTLSRVSNWRHIVLVPLVGA